MTDQRPYRPHPFSEQEAALEPTRGAGVQFDPACVAALLTVVGHRRRGSVLRLQRPDTVAQV